MSREFFFSFCNREDIGKTKISNEEKNFVEGTTLGQEEGRKCMFHQKKKKEQFVGTRADHGSKPSLAVGTAFGHNGNKIAG